jgi:hypothetical protein
MRESYMIVDIHTSLLLVRFPGLAIGVGNVNGGVAGRMKGWDLESWKKTVSGTVRVQLRNEK